jgi:enamidase
LGTLLIRNIGEFFTGDLARPRAEVGSLLVADGRIAMLDPPADTAADAILDAGGSAVMPGLVDGHVHPVFGEWTPTQDTIGWIGNYVHGGTTTMVSAGELHVPGLDYENLTPDLVTSLAVVTAATTGRVRWSGAKVQAGTAILVPGMTEAHFDRLAAAKAIVAKFLFFPLATHRDEALRYTAWWGGGGVGTTRARHSHQGPYRRRVALRAQPGLRLRHPVVAQARHRSPRQRRSDSDERR